MRIFGIVLVKNEDDIIEYSLGDACKWCDRIFVFDNGSTDDTWSIVQQLACDVIVPFKSEARPFRDGLRSEVFNAYRGEAEDGDWWCRLDTDEIYIDDPREFLKAIPSQFHCVWSKHLQYYYTDKDEGRFDLSNMDPAPKIRADNAPRYYEANFSEQRFFKHRSRLKWNQGQAWPRHVGLVAPNRIRLKHLQWRSPQQIQKRLDTRREAAATGWENFQLSLDEHWQAKIRDAARLQFDHRDGSYIIDESKLQNHLEPRQKRAVKLILHGLRVWP